MNKHRYFTVLMNHLYYALDYETLLVMQKSHLLIMLYSSDNQHSRKTKKLPNNHTSSLIGT